MKNLIFTNSLQEFFQANKENLLSPDEIFKVSEKSFSLSGFAMANKKNTQLICNNEKVIFAFPEGILFTPDKFYIFNPGTGIKIQSFNIEDFIILEASHKTFSKYGCIKVNGIEYTKEGTYKFNLNLYETLKLIIKRGYEEYLSDLEKIRIEKLRIENEEQEKLRNNLLKNQNNILSELDKDGNNEIDLIPNDFNKLLNKNQKKIIEVDKSYIHQFVKVSNFIKTKKQNTQKIFESIRETSSHVGSPYFSASLN